MEITTESCIAEHSGMLKLILPGNWWDSRMMCDLFANSMTLTPTVGGDGVHIKSSGYWIELEMVDRER